MRCFHTVCWSTDVETLLVLSGDFQFVYLQISHFLMLFHWPCLPCRENVHVTVNKLVEQRLMCPSIHPSLPDCTIAIPVNPHLHHVPQTSLRCGRLPQTLLIGRRWAANTCHFIINTCCVITDTCFRPHWLFYGGKIECNEWLNALLHLRQSSTVTLIRGASLLRLLIIVRAIYGKGQL